MTPESAHRRNTQAPIIEVPFAWTAYLRAKLMSNNNQETEQSANEFDFSRFPQNTLIHDRRNGRDRRGQPPPGSPGANGKDSSAPPEKRLKPERRRRIDPTTFDKQYTDDELEFMNAMQRFKELSGKTFPTHGEVLKVAVELGYRRAIDEPDASLHTAGLPLCDLE
jgi:hypothetical protein